MIKEKILSILGDFNVKSETHIATKMAINHSNNYLKNKIKPYWINTQKISKEMIYRSDGFLIIPNIPHSNLDNIIKVIKFARENNIPCLGTCGGFQFIIIEYARNILGFQNAHHEEYNTNSTELIITKSSCSLRGRRMELNLNPNSKVASLYHMKNIKEKYYCNYKINPKYIQIIKNSSMNIAGIDSEGEIRVIEIDNHPFFIGTLYVPQANSTYQNPHPLLNGFFNAIIDDYI